MEVLQKITLIEIFLNKFNLNKKINKKLFFFKTLGAGHI